VPDFITLDYWPTFNLADACVTVGVIVVVACLFFGGRDAVRAGEAR
jgi:lipoprotein signal peptidase